VQRGLLIACLAVLTLPAASSAGFYAPPPGDTKPTWSPDGSAIVYYHQAEGLHVVDPDGANDRLLSGLPNSPYFAFSRDWHWLALAVYEAPGRASIEVMRPDGSERRVVGHGSCCVAPDFSPDGTRLVYNDGDALVVVNVDGTGATRVAERGAYPRWSPDGLKLSYSIPTLTGPHVVVNWLDTHEVLDIAKPLFGSAPTRGATWSRDGRLAFIVGAPTRIAIYPFSRGTGNVIAFRVDSAASLEWSPDGTRLLFSAAHGLAEIDARTGFVAPIDTSGSEGDWSPDGKRVAYSSPGLCGDRAAIYVDGTRITDDCRVFGTDGPDTLTSSNSVFQIVMGLGGDDTIVGRGAAYVGDALDGGEGNDTLNGSRWPDRLTGGAGRDILRGGPGSDVLLARDGEPDLVDCGKGTDKAYVDRFDLVAYCEKVFRTS
jgi:dipeptidyl aminopeptidase/acylaminoacyl peptidase